MAPAAADVAAPQRQASKTKTKTSSSKHATARDGGGKSAQLTTDEVAAFAARLGFGGGGGAEKVQAVDSAFDDFNPAKAARKIGGAGGEKKKEKRDGEGNERAAGSAHNDGDDDDAPPSPSPGRRERKAGGRAAAAAAAAARSKDRGSALNAALEASREGMSEGKGWRRGRGGAAETPPSKSGSAAASAAASAPLASSPPAAAPPSGPAPKSILDPEAPTLWHEALGAAEEASGIPKTAEVAPAAGTSESDNAEDPSEDSVFARARAAAAVLLESEAEASRAALARSRDADARWLSRARSEGTAADRVSAAALLAGDQPAGAGLAALDDLLKLAGKRAGARAGAVAALDALSDLFCGPLLPEGRRLVPLAARPAAQLEAILKEGGGGGGGADDSSVSASSSSPASSRRQRRLACSRVLLFWGLEDALRRRAGDYLSLLETASRDGLDVVKRASARGASTLLKSRPEGEARALALLVNKLGDPDRRSASDAAHALMRVLDAHSRDGAGRRRRRRAGGVPPGAGAAGEVRVRFVPVLSARATRGSRRENGREARRCVFRALPRSAGGETVELCGGRGERRSRGSIDVEGSEAQAERKAEEEAREAEEARREALSAAWEAGQEERHRRRRG